MEPLIPHFWTQVLIWIKLFRIRWLDTLFCWLPIGQSIDYLLRRSKPAMKCCDLLSWNVPRYFLIMCYLCLLHRFWAILNLRHLPTRLDWRPLLWLHHRFHPLSSLFIKMTILDNFLGWDLPSLVPIMIQPYHLWISKAIKLPLTDLWISLFCWSWVTGWSWF